MGYYCEGMEFAAGVEADSSVDMGAGGGMLFVRGAYRAELGVCGADGGFDDAVSDPAGGGGLRGGDA